MIKGKLEVNLNTQVAQNGVLLIEEETPNSKNTLEDFNWEEYENVGNPKLKVNKTIKSEHREFVYSHMSYAQEMYNLYSDSFNEHDFYNPNKGETVEGLVKEITESSIYLDINYREYAVIDIKKERKQYIENLKINDMIDVLVLNEKKGDNIIKVSYTDNIKKTKVREIKDSINKPIAFESTVISLTNGGFIMDIDGIECFMPGSQVTMNKIDNFESYIGKKLIVMAVNYSDEKQTIVVSSREYLKTLVPIEINKIKENIDKKQTGIVTGTTKFGIFCEFNKCLTGLIYISDIEDSSLAKFNNRMIKAGDKIEFYIKDIINNNKIILTQKKENNPWLNINERYLINSVVDGKVIAIKDYGSFIELEPKISGLLHTSQYDVKKLKLGDNIRVKITKLDKENHKITLIKY